MAVSKKTTPAKKATTVKKATAAKAPKAPEPVVIQLVGCKSYTAVGSPQNFKKGIPTPVSPQVAKKMLAVRLDGKLAFKLVSGSVQAKAAAEPDPAGEPDDSEEQSGSDELEQSEDPQGEYEALMEAIKSFDPEDESKWTEDGAPDANVLSDVLNRQVSAAERDVAWAQVQSELDTGVEV